MNKQLFFLTVFLLLIGPVKTTTGQTNYYVDGSAGNDLNSGTSLNNAWKTIQKACDVALPNSTIQIKTGTYRENIVVNVSGTAGNPITFKAC